MSKLPYIINDIKEFVHVPLDRHRAVLLRVKDIETRRGNKRVFNPVLFSKASPKGGIPFWVETPHIGPKIKDAFAEAHKALKMKALMHLQ